MRKEKTFYNRDVTDLMLDYLPEPVVFSVVVVSTMAFFTMPFWMLYVLHLAGVMV